MPAGTERRIDVEAIGSYIQKLQNFPNQNRNVSRDSRLSVRDSVIGLFEVTVIIHREPFWPLGRSSIQNRKSAFPSP